MTPLAIDLFCGLGGWTEGLIAQGYDVVGFDIERHDYGDGKRYPAQLVLQDVLTLHGRQFKDATLIVASPPCQEYSYMAMPWSRAKRIAEEYRSGVRDLKKLTVLFDACFRIRREASEAAGHKIPLVVENVKGAQKWVGRSRWHYGSYYLWGDVPALMPIAYGRKSQHTPLCETPNGTGKTSWFFGNSKHEGRYYGTKSTGMNWSNRELKGQDFTLIAGQQAIKNSGGSWFNVAHNKESGCGNHPDGRKGVGGTWFEGNVGNIMRQGKSKSSARKAASAMIAKIPLPLAQHIAWAWKPRESCI